MHLKQLVLALIRRPAANCTFTLFTKESAMFRSIKMPIFFLILVLAYWTFGCASLPIVKAPIDIIAFEQETADIPLMAGDLPPPTMFQAFAVNYPNPFNLSNLSPFGTIESASDAKISSADTAFSELIATTADSAVPAVTATEVTTDDKTVSVPAGLEVVTFNGGNITGVSCVDILTSNNITFLLS